MMDWYKEVPQLEKHIIDVLSVGTVVGTMASFLPHVAAVFTILWTGIRIFETDTMQKILGRKKEEKEDA